MSIDCEISAKVRIILLFFVLFENFNHIGLELLACMLDNLEVLMV